MFTNDVDGYVRKKGWNGLTGDACFVTYTDGSAELILHPKASTPLVVHEATHCVNALFRSVVHDLNSEDDEPVAYMMQYLVANVLKFQKEVRGKFRA